MNDARALASPNLTILLVGNKLDLADQGHLIDLGPVNLPSNTPTSISSRETGAWSTSSHLEPESQWTATEAPDGREISTEEASRWASSNSITASIDVSAMSGENVEEVFHRLGRIILTKIELGEINPDDPMSGVQYGDSCWFTEGDGVSVKSGMTGQECSSRRRTKSRLRIDGMKEWQEVFRLRGNSRRKSSGCC